MVSLGAALVAGVGSGLYTTAQDAIKSSYQARERFEPMPFWQARYEPIYQHYKQLITALTK
jgi:sugar (pentulose or hexulose) kinase